MPQSAPNPSGSRAHAAVKHELLVRYLDAWLPAALHGHKRVTYVDSSADAAAATAAARVICEFDDMLARHSVTMVVATTAVVLADPPAGLTLHPTTGPLLTALRDTHALGSPIFAWFDGPVPGDLVSTVASNKASDLMLSSTELAMSSILRKAGLDLIAAVELVDAEGGAELLMFATASPRSLEKFKDELWNLDEYAGIRLRDPSDLEGTLLDISVQPQLGPLRRALVAHVTQTGGSTVAELKSWALQETIYRAADATKAVQSLVTSGMTTRDPIGGRLSPDTVIRPLAAADAAGELDELADVDE